MLIIRGIIRHNRIPRIVGLVLLKIKSWRTHRINVATHFPFGQRRTNKWMNFLDEEIPDEDKLGNSLTITR